MKHKAIKLAWLAGFADSDGMITVSTNRTSNLSSRPGYKGVTYSPEIRFTNTSIKTSKYVMKLCKQLDLNAKIIFRKSKVKRWLQTWQIYIRGQHYVAKTIILLLPYLITKKREAELTLKFIESRFDGENHLYNTCERKLVELVTDLKYTRNSSRR